METKQAKIYEGFRDEDGVMVMVNGVGLDPKKSQKVFNHSPTGFEWGYSGSGPAQLALAILLDYTNDKELSLQLHQKFKGSFTSLFHRKAQDGAVWKIEGADIDAFLKEQTAERKGA